VTGGSNTYNLYYDALGRCVKRTLNSTTTYYIYDGEKPILEYRSTDLSNPAKNVYGKGIDEPSEWGHREMDGQAREGSGRDERERTSQILMRYDPTLTQNKTFYYQQDHEGSVTHLLSTSGDVIEKYKYDAFGLPFIYDANDTLLSSSAKSNRFMFTGREYANLFNFYEYRARAYNPILGRFMSEDRKLFDAGDYNLFRYCHNDPVDFADPMGLSYGSTAGQHQTPEIQQAMDREYNKIMADAQWSNSGAIAAGMSGYQEWSGSFGMANADGSGTRQMRTSTGGSNNSYLEAYGLDRGWGNENASVAAAVDTNLKPHLYGTGDNTEIGGGTFRNKNGTWGYSVIHSDRNTARKSLVIGVPPNRIQHRSWHIHTGQPHLNANEFSRADKEQPYAIYLGTPNHMIKLFDRSLTPHEQVIRPASIPDY